MSGNISSPRSSSQLDQQLTVPNVKFHSDSIKNAYLKTASPDKIAASENSGFFHILIPADRSDVNLCKTILSATILGYPTPTLYNWAKTGDKMAKISGGLDYLRALDSNHDEDMVLLVDGFDLWFQLSPQIMIDRYNEINNRAHERMRGRVGDEVMDTSATTQTIIFSSQKRCWPGKGDDLSCYAVPESSLPRYIYGPQTDIDVGDTRNPYLKFRQRWLNAGFMIGPVNELRTLFERALERAEANPNQEGNDQNVLSTIWGEQEYVREAARLSKLPPWKRGQRAPRKAFEPATGTNYEFGIGLDYESALSIPTVFAEYDSQWVVFSDSKTLDKAFSEYNITDPRATSIQADVANEPTPFNSIRNDKADDGRLPTQSMSWKEVPLYTNLWTGIIPAVIHHNAHRNGLKSLRQTVWDRMWFQPYARALLNARMREPYKPIAVSKSNGRKWFSTMDGERSLGAWTDNAEQGGWMDWTDLCSAQDQEEIFRDGKGPWVKQDIGEESVHW